MTRAQTARVREQAWIAVLMAWVAGYVDAIGWVARNADTQTRSLGVPDRGGSPQPTDSEAIAGYDPTDNRVRQKVRVCKKCGSDL